MVLMVAGTRKCAYGLHEAGVRCNERYGMSAHPDVTAGRPFNLALSGTARFGQTLGEFLDRPLGKIDAKKFRAISREMQAYSSRRFVIADTD